MVLNHAGLKFVSYHCCQDQHMANVPTLLKSSYNAVWMAEHLLGALPGFPDPALRGFDRARHALNASILRSLSQKGGGAIRPLERVRDLSPERFRSEYLEPGRPVVLAGMAKDWACMRRWSPEYFATEFGDYELHVMNDYHEDRGGAMELTLLRDYVETLTGDTDRYARLSRILHDHPELKADLDLGTLGRFRRRTDRWVANQFFMGPPRSATVLHCAFINNLFVQVYGRKRWIIFSPEYNSVFMPPVDRAPTFRASERWAGAGVDASLPLEGLNGYEVILEPGDVLFNPSFHWHHVTNMTVSISVSCRFWSLPSALQSSPMLSAVTALATNPPAFLAVLRSWRGTNFLNFYRPG